MSHSHISRSSTFLMELIISILIFSLTSAIIIQVYAKTYKLGQESQDLNNAILKVQNIIAMLQAGFELEQEPIDNKVTLYYDYKWSKSTKESSSYRIDINIIIENNNKYVNIKSFSTHLIYELDQVIHIPYKSI